MQLHSQATEYSKEHKMKCLPPCPPGTLSSPPEPPALAVSWLVFQGCPLCHQLVCAQVYPRESLRGRSQVTCRVDPVPWARVPFLLGKQINPWWCTLKIFCWQAPAHLLLSRPLLPVFWDKPPASSEDEELGSGHGHRGVALPPHCEVFGQAS